MESNSLLDIDDIKISTDFFDSNKKLESNNNKLSDINNSLFITATGCYVKNKEKKFDNNNNINDNLLIKDIDNLILKNYNMIYLSINNGVFRYGFKLTEYISRRGYKLVDRIKHDYCDASTTIYCLVKV